MRELELAEVPIKGKLSDLTLAKITDELRKKTENMLKNVAKAAAKWEKDKKELLAKWESHWRNELHEQAKRYGVDALRTGDPNVDKFLGDLSTTGKRAGGWVSDTWKDAGGAASDFVKNPVGTLKDIRFGLDAEYTLVDESRDRLADIVDQVQNIHKPEDVVAILGGVLSNGGSGGSIPFPGVPGGIPIPGVPGGVPGGIPIPGVPGGVPIPGVPGGVPIPGVPGISRLSGFAPTRGGFRDSAVLALNDTAVRAGRQLATKVTQDQQAKLVAAV